MTLRHVLTFLAGFNTPPIANPDGTLVVDGFDDGTPAAASPVAPTVSPLTASNEEELHVPPSPPTPERIGCVKHLGYCPENCPNFKPGQLDRASETSDDDDDKGDEANETNGEEDDGEGSSDEDDDVLEYVKIGCAKHLSYCDKACPRYWFQFAPEHRPQQRPQQPVEGTKRKRAEDEDEPETTSKKRRCAIPLGRDRILWAMARQRHVKV